MDSQEIKFSSRMKGKSVKNMSQNSHTGIRKKCSTGCNDITPSFRINLPLEKSDVLTLIIIIVIAYLIALTMAEIFS